MPYLKAKLDPDIGHVNEPFTRPILEDNFAVSKFIFETELFF